MTIRLRSILFPAIGLIIICTAIFFSYRNILGFFWKEIDGRIVSSSTISYPVNAKYRGTILGANSRVDYQYDINGKSYLGSDMMIDRYINANSLKARLNNPIKLIYDPKDLEQSMIKPDFPFIQIIFILFGLILIISPIINMKAKNGL